MDYFSKMTGQCQFYDSAIEMKNQADSGFFRAQSAQAGKSFLTGTTFYMPGTPRPLWVRARYTFKYPKARCI